MSPWPKRAAAARKKAARDELLALPKLYDAAKMRAYPIGAAVGNVRNQGPELIEPLAAARLSASSDRT